MEPYFLEIEAALAELGALGAVLAVLLMAVVSILPFPAEAPAMINGMLFGPIYGTALSFLGALIGAVVSFELARSVGRPLAAKMVSKAALARVDDSVSRAGWGGLLIARLIPVIAFTALNWGSGLTAVPRGRFIWTTALGILPGVILFTGLGSAVPTLFSRQPLWTLFGTAAVVVAVLVASWVLRRGTTPISSGSEPPKQ